MCLRVSLELHLCAVVMLVCNSAGGSWCPEYVFFLFPFFVFISCLRVRQTTQSCVYKPHFLIYILLSLQTGFLFGKT